MFNSDSGRPHASFSHTLSFASLLLVAVVFLISACSKPVEKAEEIRPVRAMTISNGNIEVVTEFPGEVRARVESRLGFRVPGKIVSRKIEVGSPVRRGQVLAQLDPQDLKLAQAQADAALKAAESNLALARSELGRYQDLRAKNFVSQAVLEAKDSAVKAEQSHRDQALAAYKNQSNQAAYASLVSDIDGVVTAVEAEAGQVVAAGTPVVRIAQSGEKEVVIGIPESKIESLRKIGDVRVRIWAQADRQMQGKVREIAPAADPVTRTYTAKIAIPDASDEVRLGMTAYVAFTDKTPESMIKIPLSALVQEKNSTAVWAVDNGTVKLTPVHIGGLSENDVLISGGLVPGQTIVTAGVNMLKPGQKIKILEEASVASMAAPLLLSAGDTQ